MARVTTLKLRAAESGLRGIASKDLYATWRSSR
jgi:hypothetical protein